MAWHCEEAGAVVRSLGSDAAAGLASDLAAQRLREDGPNELAEEEKTPLWKLILEQFEDLLVRILLGAAVLSFAIALFEEGLDGGLHAFVEPLVILTILVLNAAMGVWQESNAESALDALKRMQSTTAKVLRAGRVEEVPSSQLVRGDVVEVAVGDRIPADMRVLSLQTTTMSVDESALTGESKTVQKDSSVAAGPEIALAERHCMLYSSTTVSTGRARGVVVATGMRTEIGKIQAAVTKAKEEEERTPLGKKLDDFGEWLSKVIAAICVVVWLMNARKFFDPTFSSPVMGMIYYLKIAVALGVAAIPEGLPAVITLCLALGTRKMVRRNAIVRKLPSVETLGCTTVICSDKTGTLTTNKMSVVAVSYFSAASPAALLSSTVEGHTFRPSGAISGVSSVTDAASLVEVAKVCALCNESQLRFRDGDFVRIGEPTEAALRVLAEKLGVPGQTCAEAQQAAEAGESFSSPASSYWQSRFQRVAVLEFSRDRKSMSVICKPTGAAAGATAAAAAAAAGRPAAAAAGGNVLFVKGAAEMVLERCTHVRLGDGKVVLLTAALRQQVQARVNEMAQQALRCLALATKEDLGKLSTYDGESHPAHADLRDPSLFAAIESGLTFVGLCGIKDPARPEVRRSIELCQTAGIRVIMITGDNKATAESIARDIGIFERDEEVAGKSFVGAEFMKLPEERQLQLLMEGGGSRVFSRAEPVHKQQLVRLLKQSGEVVAMTGDGVNDAPALKQADIGIAMGISGTEVAKEASAMVLADDNFATIVSAVEEGRAIYNNMKAFIRYLISSNIGEVASIFLTAALGFPEGMIPVQLLWVNLVTDGPPATALGFNPADDDIMLKPPRRADDQLITPWVFFRYLVIGVYVGVATVGIFGFWYMYYDWAADGHTLVSYAQLTNWGQCPTWTGFTVADFGGMSFASNPCSYFTAGKVKASTLSLTVLVTIEMFNALNALSEDGSLLQVLPWSNPWLLLAIAASFGVHLVILYVPFLSTLFSITPLDWEDWKLVLLFSFPVVLIDEALKLIARVRNSKELSRRRAAAKKHN